MTMMRMRPFSAPPPTPTPLAHLYPQYPRLFKVYPFCGVDTPCRHAHPPHLPLAVSACMSRSLYLRPFALAVTHFRLAGPRTAPVG